MQLDLGDMRVDSVLDLERMDFPMAMLLPASSAEALEPLRAWMEPDHYDSATGTFHLACHSLLLRFGERVVLVDTCVGCGKPRAARATWNMREHSQYLAGLAAVGVSPEQVDTVFCTHLHVDHVGWNTQLLDGRWVPTFPNARYLFGRAEFAHWEARANAPDASPVNHGSFVDSVLPVVEAGLVEFVDDGYEVADGITLGMLAGHTPGQMGLFTRDAVFCGDAIHSPAQIARPEWSSGFCADPDLAMRTRTGILEHAVEHGRVVVPAHFRGAGAVRVTRRGGAFHPSFGAG